MSEFLTLLPPDALRLLLENLVIEPQPERVPSAESCIDVVVDSVIAPLNLPSFIRATVDGYAVHSADTHGAGESLPAYLKLVGEVRMGTMPVAPLQSGQCMIIHTGGMLPEGADVVMVEHTQQALTDEIEILRAVGVGENVLNIGEDVRRGDGDRAGNTPAFGRNWRSDGVGHQPLSSHANRVSPFYPAATR